MERRALSCCATLIAAACFIPSSLFAASYADLKAEVEQLRKDVNARAESHKAIVGGVDDAVANKYGPDLVVKAASAPKLTISGWLQVWYQSPQHDNTGVAKQSYFFPPSGPPATVLPETFSAADNSTFRIRRSELRFNFDVNKNITATVMMDPARESSAGFMPLPTFPRHNSVQGPLIDSRLPFTQLVTTGDIPASTVQPHLLQDAYIIFRDRDSSCSVIKHHELQIGQFKPPVGEEALRDTGWLDFVDRAMVTSINNVRDLGVQIKGSWLENDRISYRLGLFNGPSGTVLSDPEITEAGNRADDNNEKDFAWRVAVRPVWVADVLNWHGWLELGYHRTDGRHGKTGQEFNPDFALNAENLTHTAINRQGAWAAYSPGGPVRGWWFRGEWGSGHDRFGAGGAYTSLLGLGSIDLGATGPRGGGAFTQADPTPVTAQGWFVSSGYKLSDSRFAESLAKGSVMERELNKMEFAVRYETYQNITTEDLVNPDRKSNQFKTQVYTGGVNYYIKGQYAKIQANYMIVDDPQSRSHALREVKNNVFALNFQVGF